MSANVILEAKNIVKKFGGIVANNDVSIHLNEGEILGLIGSNGAGKTTLFNMIAGAFSPTSGSIYIDGVEVSKLQSHEVCKRGVGRTYQIVQPFASLTVLENTMVGALLKEKNVDKAREKSIEVLKLVGLDKKKDIIGKQLSLPELKKMEVARALATEPKILLLDEVMAGLNPTESAEMIKLVRKINDTGVSIIIIEHVMKVIMSLSDRIYVLNQGELIAEGSPEEVSRDEKVIASYFGERKYVKNS